MAFFLKNKFMGVISQISVIYHSLLNQVSKINKLKEIIHMAGIFALITFNPGRDFT